MDMDRMVVLAIGLVAAAVPSSVPWESPSTTAAPQALSGGWRINPEKSEDGSEKLRAAAAERRPGGSGPGARGPSDGRGPGGGFGGRGSGRRGGAPGWAQGDSGDSMRSLLESATEMTIAHTETEIAVVDEDGRLRLLHPDGEPYQDATGSQVKTRWEKDRLIVEAKSEEGAKVTETFTLSAEPRQLVVDVRIESPFLGPVTVRRVYDPEAPE